MRTQSRGTITATKARILHFAFNLLGIWRFAAMPELERVLEYRRKASELMTRAQQMTSEEVATEMRALALQWLMLAGA